MYYIIDKSTVPPRNYRDVMPDLQLSPIQLNPEYRDEWNVHMTDFVVLTINGVIVNNSIYRVGGMGGDINQDYFMLLKYTEAYYPADFMRTIKSRENPKHLEGSWCILDRYGNEKIIFNHFKSPYLVKNSCIYSIDGSYFNVETGERYCNSHTSMESSEFLFLDNPHDADLSKRGVMKINKKNGSWSVFR